MLLTLEEEVLVDVLKLTLVKGGGLDTTIDIVQDELFKSKKVAWA